MSGAHKKSATRLRLRLKPLQRRRVEETLASNGMTCVRSGIKPFKTERILARSLLHCKSFLCVAQSAWRQQQPLNYNYLI